MIVLTVTSITPCYRPIDRADSHRLNYNALISPTLRWVSPHLRYPIVREYRAFPIDSQYDTARQWGGGLTIISINYTLLSACRLLFLCHFRTLIVRRGSGAVDSTNNTLLNAC